MPESRILSTGEILAKLVKKYNLDSEISVTRLFENWSSIVEPGLAKICHPVEIQNNVLVLKVKNEVWKRELAMNRKELLNSIKTKIKGRKINDIKFI